MREQMTIEAVNQINKCTLMESLGIEYTHLGEDYVEATMPVDNRTKQPTGILHGGATIALAETLAGVGSYLHITEQQAARGMQVSANHLSAARGGSVRAVGRLIHKGHVSHVWDIEVFCVDTERLVSSVRITNCIIEK